ncbi:MAG: response regulator [Magnetococcus sp. DMHC-6]
MEITKSIGIVLVERSAVARTLTRRGLQRLSIGDKSIQILGEARHGEEAFEMVAALRPQVICLDLYLPQLEGLTLVRKVMEQFPCPIILLGMVEREGDKTDIFRYFEAGALDMLLRPLNWTGAGGEAFFHGLVERIQLLAELNAHVVESSGEESLKYSLPDRAVETVQMVVLGSGLGGIPAVREILSALPANFSVPILCIQHFTSAKEGEVDSFSMIDYQGDFIRWLGSEVALAVQMATDGEVPMAGSVYFAPPFHHLSLDNLGRLVTSQAPMVAGQRPSISVTMESVSALFGAAVIGVLVSAHGQDGLLGMERIKHNLGVTIAQDEISALVFDAPGAAIAMGNVAHVLPCSEIAQALRNLVGEMGDGEHLCTKILPGSKRKEKILIVEDSATQAFKLKRFLQQSGFQVLVGRDGMEGLEHARSWRPDLVISDVSMPKMDGFELCRTLKNDSALATKPVMLLTALTNPSEILEGLDAGADNYLTKPWEENGLLGQIEGLLQPLPIAEDRRRAMEITFEGRQYRINTSRWQILNLLLSTYQRAVQQNKALTDSQLELKMLNLQLVDQSVRQENLNIKLKEEILERQQIEQRQREVLEELQLANRELDDFTYIVSHDLKAPFRAIGSLTNWLLADYADSLDAEGKELVTLLAGRADRINALMDALLEYTKVTRFNATPVLVDLRRVVTEIISGLVLPEELEVVVETPLPTLFLDPVRADRIFGHLIHNAVFFMDKKPGKIGLVRVGANRQGEDWLFYVADNGPGIEEGYHEKIFKIFQTLKPRDELETNGIGLALVRKIIAKQGGRIWVESQLGYGSTFWFTLPGVG